MSRFLQKMGLTSGSEILEWMWTVDVNFTISACIYKVGVSWSKIILCFTSFQFDWTQWSKQVIGFEKEAGIEIIQLKVSNSVAVHRGNRQMQMSWKGVQNSLKLVQELGAGTVWLILILANTYSAVALIILGSCIGLSIYFLLPEDSCFLLVWCDNNNLKQTSVTVCLTDNSRRHVNDIAVT
jgi:hypothetical protein